MEVFIVLFWFWEGDGNLVNSYRDCYLSLQNAIDAIQSGSDKIDEAGKPCRIYTPDEEIPARFGYCDEPPFIQIVKKVFDK